MKQTIPAFLLTGCVLLSACSAQPIQPSSPSTTSFTATAANSAAAARVHVFECEQLDFSVQPLDNGVLLHLPKRSVRLPQVPAASGARYQNDQELFWSHGGSATVVADGKRHTECTQNITRIPRDQAGRRPIDFRAVGHQPGWFLEIAAGEPLRLHTDYGRKRLLGQALKTERRAGQTTYSTQADGHQLSVTIQAAACQDPLTQLNWDSTVIVEIDGNAYPGCGNHLK